MMPATAKKTRPAIKEAFAMILQLYHALTLESKVSVDTGTHRIYPLAKMVGGCRCERLAVMSIKRSGHQEKETVI